MIRAAIATNTHLSLVTRISHSLSKNTIDILFLKIEFNLTRTYMNIFKQKNKRKNKAILSPHNNFSTL